MSVRMSIAGYRREGRASIQEAPAPAPSEVERSAYQNLALVRMRALRSQIDDAITRAQGKTTDRYSYTVPEPKREDYRTAVVKIIDAAIQQWEAEAHG